MNGWILLDKPVGISSFQAIYQLKEILNVKVGHCGTLDPFASGFLLVAIGKATRLVEYGMNKVKDYNFEIKWGVSTDTADLYGNTVAISSFIPTQKQIQDVMPKFIGHINQVPPIYSAVKIKGKRAYDYARKGHTLQLKSRKVILSKFELIEHNGNKTKFKIETSKGFYVRSLAVDLASSLNALAHVVTLRRNPSGIFKNNEMININKIKEHLQSNELYDYILSKILSLDYVLDDIPVHNLSEKTRKKLKNGVKVPYNLSLENGSKIAVLHDKALIAICEYHSCFIKPLKVF